MMPADMMDNQAAACCHRFDQIVKNELSTLMVLLQLRLD